MKTIVLSVLLLASTAASAATKCVGTTDRMNLQISEAQGSVHVLFQMTPRDYSKYNDPKVPGVDITFQEGVSYNVTGMTADELLKNKDVLTKMVVNGIYRTAYFAGEEDMAYADAGDLIAKLQCQ